MGTLLFGHQYHDMHTVIRTLNILFIFTDKMSDLNEQLGSSFEFLAFSLIAFDPTVMFVQVLKL